MWWPILRVRSVLYNLSTSPRPSSHYQWPVRHGPVSPCVLSSAWLVCVRFLPTVTSWRVPVCHQDSGHAALTHGKWHRVNTNTGQSTEIQRMRLRKKNSRTILSLVPLSSWWKFPCCSRVRKVCVNFHSTTEYSAETLIYYHPSFAVVIIWSWPGSNDGPQLRLVCFVTCQDME